MVRKQIPPSHADQVCHALVHRDRRQIPRRLRAGLSRSDVPFSRVLVGRSPRRPRVGAHHPITQFGAGRAVSRASRSSGPRHCCPLSIGSGIGVWLLILRRGDGHGGQNRLPIPRRRREGGLPRPCRRPHGGARQLRRIRQTAGRAGRRGHGACLSLAGAPSALVSTSTDMQVSVAM